MGTQLATEKNGTPTLTQFLALVYRGQMARWVKMPLGTEVNLRSDDVVWDGVAPPSKRGTAPSFSAHVYCSQMAAWMDEDAHLQIDLGPARPHCVRRGPSSIPPRAKGAEQSPPLFTAHVYCGHGRPSQLMVNSCNNSNDNLFRQETA